MEPVNVEQTILESVPAEMLSAVQGRLFGAAIPVVALSEEVAAHAEAISVELKSYDMTSLAQKEPFREARTVKIAAIQNATAAATDLPIDEQYNKNVARLVELYHASIKAGGEVICFQEACTAPFFFCLREKLPWTYLAENAETGATVRTFKELTSRDGSVVVLPILERDPRADRIWNTAVVIDSGRCVGKARKAHIPAVGDFNERNYYSEDVNQPLVSRHESLLTQHWDHCSNGRKSASFQKFSHLRYFEVSLIGPGINTDVDQVM
ncbi:hypothetical protein KIPB_002193 [Kipferlia bialata]|uniref:CN hydrolase domain-containing protein n=1 Tax=Kipferlia bialata TaxID=797122 RepID=A0A9K3CRT2_9EUKA|nr:hypothetical protein KIPB_002193 [Kipferlia bialata]|eukprot:g2193.t1